MLNSWRLHNALAPHLLRHVAGSVGVLGFAVLSVLFPFAFKHAIVFALENTISVALFE